MTPNADSGRVISWAEDPDAIDWLNDLLANAGDEWDLDEDMWTIAVRYVRHLEALAHSASSGAP